MNLNNFTIKAQEVVQAAQQEAFNLKNVQIETAHLLDALLTESEDTMEYLFKKNNANISSVEKRNQYLINKFATTSNEGGQILSRDLNTVLLKSNSFLKDFKDEFVSVEHLLLALLTTNDAVSKLLKEEGLNEKNLKTAILDLRKGSTVSSQNADAQYNALQKYAKNLNELAAAGKLDPVIGRDEEIRRTLHILSRRTKNNPILVGEPGVGKTAIAEGIAHRIMNGDVPENLKNKIIFALLNSIYNLFFILPFRFQCITSSRKIGNFIAQFFQFLFIIFSFNCLSLNFQLTDFSFQFIQLFGQ
jgi:ATP-dependent Clp protease ATP-binding subunit ClpB